MGRRKKEPREVHRKNIAIAAEKLFREHGIQATSMEQIAKEAGYSKATLYVYYENKEEIVGVLTLESMEKLLIYIEDAVEDNKSTKERYIAICNGLLQYQQEYPFYFKTVLGKINIDFDKEDVLAEEVKTYHVGEMINEKVSIFFDEGMKHGDLRQDIQILPTIFIIWSMLAGLILTAENKEAYIRKEMGMTKQEFLRQGFESLYYSIKK